MQIVDVIVPIYSGLAEVRRCLESVIASTQECSYELVLILDAPTEIELIQYVRVFAATEKNTMLLENERNLGFVGTVNRGMALHPDRDVVLLNSDTQVTGNWLDRMIRCSRQGKFATVTPFSNNATICSFPKLCESNQMPSGFLLPEIDKAFSCANTDEFIEIPTGVGFCMFIKRECIAQIGYFDEKTFGKGYGEENDFCLRASNAGWRNVLCCDAFVFHEGGVSFSDEKNDRVEKAQRILEEKYPKYHTDVYSHIVSDPALYYRINAQLELIGRHLRPKILHITHHLGGGTQKHIRELASFLKNEVFCLTLRPYGADCVALDIIEDPEWETLYFALPAQLDDLNAILSKIGISRIHFHHTIGLETSVWGLPSALGIPFDITLHDYHFIAGNPSMTDDEGLFSEDISVENSRYRRTVSIEQWQRNQRVLLDAAEHIISPSKATSAIFNKHYPDLKTIQVYHTDWYMDSPYPNVGNTIRNDSESLRVLVTGALSLEKGAEMLERVAMASASKGYNLEFILLGYACRPLNKAVKVLGAYDSEQICELMQEIDPHLIWFPALWPETYSYTLSEALKTGRPILVPDIGAFQERTNGRPYTWTYPWNIETDDMLEIIAAIHTELALDIEGGEREWSTQLLPESDGGFYKNDYMHSINVVNSSLKRKTIETDRIRTIIEDSRKISKNEVVTIRRERFLHKLVRIRRTYLGGFISRIIPLRIQRAIKRKLSSKPIHEI